MTSETLVAPTWRTYQLARTATTLLGTLSLLAGVCGQFVTVKPHRRTEARGLIFGGAIALISVLSLESAYRAISWTLTGGTEGLSAVGAFLPSESSSALYGSTTSADRIEASTAGSVARTAAVLGLLSTSIGCSLWAISPVRPSLRRGGVRGITLGLALLSISVGSRLFEGIYYAVGWSP